MKKVLLSISFVGVLFLSPFAQDAEKYITKSAHINFFSHTSVEDISADNYAVVSTINSVNGDVVFSVPMQSFEFEKALMQKHFNSANFLDTKTYPKAKFKGKITNLSEVNFTEDGIYEADLEGEMTIHGVTKQVKEKGTITVKGGKVTVDASTHITLAEYEIAFEKGKPSTNIAKEVSVKLKAEYSK